MSCAFHFRQVQNKVASVLKAIAKLGKLNRSLEKCIKNSKTNTEIEDLVMYLKTLFLSLLIMQGNIK